jgi:hypothetical protein
MVAPLVIMAAATVASSAMQWMNSKQAQEASQDERDRMMALLNKVKNPNFDVNEINPEDLRVVRQYIPEATSFIEEIAPQQVKAQSAGAVAGRQAQLDALGQYKRLMQQGYDPQTAMEMAKAQRGMAAESASARQTATAEAARRGFGGGPSFYQAGADQAGMDRLAQMQQAALTDAAQRRLAATGQSANLGGQIRGEDVSLEQANVNAINAFNQRQASRRQDWALGQANMRNQAQQYNIGEEQRVADTNKRQAYDAAVRNQGTRNTAAQNQFNNALAKISGQQPQSAQQQAGYAAQAEQQNKSIQAMTDLASKIAMEKYKNDQDKYTKG